MLEAYLSDLHLEAAESDQLQTLELNLIQSSGIFQEIRILSTMRSPINRHPYFCRFLRSVC